MSLWRCTECTTAYAVGLPSCPHCQSTSREDGAMPKITKAGGPSHEAVPDAAPEVEHPAPEVEPAEPEPAPVEKRPRTRARRDSK